MGDWKGSGEERDNKAGGDVNSQIGSFSCFPEPATLDGWLRQRRECIRETRAPPQGWGNGGEGGRCSLAGVCGEGTPEGCKERNGPRKRATLGENEGKLHKLVISLPVCNLWAPETAPGVGGGQIVGVYVPSGLRRERRGVHPWGSRWEREAGQKTVASSSPFLPSSTVLLTVLSPPLLYFPSSLWAPSSLFSLCLFLRCVFPASSPSPPL